MGSCLTLGDFDRLDPRFAWMRDYLARVAPPGHLPGRRHVDPLAFKALLDFVNLVDVEHVDGAYRFRFRLVGVHQTIAAGREITGRFLEDAVLPAFVERIGANMRTAAESRQPVHDAFPMPHPGRDAIATERVYFPLASDGTNVDMLLIVNAYPGDPKLNTLVLPQMPLPAGGLAAN
ncbi:MAG: PAS domain-containing protein [Alphaproteobacteria bacterium]|nr:PAS domain-containing protein [Alphaproteobacteria bacterium]